MRIPLFILACGFCLFLGCPEARADEIAELKAQIKVLQETIETLNTKVGALEEKQKAQEKDAVQVSELKQTVEELKEKPKGLFENVHVGGHLKLFVFDRSEGNRNGTHQHDNLSAGLNNLYLYFTKNLTEWLGLEVQTDTQVTSSATPKLGSNITRSKSARVSTNIHQAFMTLRLPKGYELKVGVFNPLFSEDYARETWWHQLYHLNFGLLQLAAYHDSGMELYKNFDFNRWSLPVYLYYLNGNTTTRFVDNNEGKSVLIHVAPEFFNTSLRLLGSFGYGKWDDGNNYDMFRYAGGLDWKFKKLNVLAEYLYNRQDSLLLSGGARADGANKGYHIKTIYRFTPKWQGLIDYSHADLFNTESSAMRTDTYDEVAFGADYFLTDSSTIIGQFTVGDASRSDGSEKLKYKRFTLGWRTTF